MQNTPESQESEIEAIQTSPELGMEGRGVMSCDECGLVDHGPNARAISRDVNRTPTT
jgi:hypothetical protein